MVVLYGPLPIRVLLGELLVDIISMVVHVH